MPDAPTFEIEVSQTIIQNGVEVQTGPVYQVTMQLGTGPAGDAATVAVGTVSTLAAGSPATVTNSGTGEAAVLDFGIPAGHDGTGTVNSVNGKSPDGSGAVTLAASDLSAVPTSRKVSAGTGLSGGGDLSADRSLSVSYGTTAGTAAQGNDSRITGAVPNTRTVNGKALSANITLAASDVSAAPAASAQGVTVTDKSSAYTLAVADAGTVIRSTASGAITITVPASTFSSGQIVEILQYGAGQVTVAAGSGVTLRLAAAGLKTKAQYSSLSILFLSATEAVVSGDGAA